MPLKYQKLVFFFSLGIMFIGLCTFSIISPNLQWPFSAPSKENSPSQVSSFGAILAADEKISSDDQVELEELVRRYLTAKQQVDMGTIEQCVSDVSHVEEKKLLAESEYVESYENVQCKVLEGPKKGTYRVYAYYEVKIYNINTLLPSLTALYITTNQNNLFQIYLGTLESEEQHFVDNLDESAEIQGLISNVQNRLSDVINSDNEAKEFYEMLESVDE